MSIGKISDVAPDPVLTRLAVELGTGGPYIADMIAPVATVERDYFKYATYSREDIKDDTKTSRAPGDPANEVNFSKSYTTGTVVYHGLKSKIPDEIRANDPIADATHRRRVKVLTGKLRLGVERRVAAILTAASNTNAAPSVKWDAASGVVMRKNILDAMNVFRRQAGFAPNVLVVPPIVNAVMVNNTELLDLLRYTQNSLLADGQFKVIEGMKIVVPGGIQDTSNPGAAASIADVYASDEVYFMYVDPSAGNDLEAPTAVRQVRSTASSGNPFTAYSWRDPDLSAKSDWVAVDVAQIEMAISQSFILRQLDVLT